MTSLPHAQKRDWSQYSRSTRNKRKLESAAEECQKIDVYFPIIQKIDKVLVENLELKKQLHLAMKNSFRNSQVELTDGTEDGTKVLSMLLECAKNNAGKKPGGLRYSATIKELGTLLYTLGGPTLYGIICSNLPFPSISNVRRNLLSSTPLKECVFRMKELKELLLRRKLPLRVYASEDGTVVTGRIQYDSRSNQLVGFVPALDDCGLPIPESFPATSAAQMQEHFRHNAVSRIAYVIMIQPLEKTAAPFCLALFGTNNKFEASQITRRWKWMLKAANEEGIEIVGVSSDGDPKLLRAMYSESFLNVPSQKWPWFNVLLDNSHPVFIQDTIHLLVKLKSKLLMPSVIIPMGTHFIASRAHIVELINTTSKDQHELTMSFLDVKDKMNFRAAQKLCAEKVTNLLRNIAGSEATATYLDMMRDITAAFLEPQLQPLERVKIMWHWLFFLRLWRKWISNHGEYSLSHNFITANSYTCVELNAHGLVNLIRKFRDTQQPQLFMPWLCSSQPCEDFFRRTRSLTSTNSTVTNFSILELVHRIRRIDFIGESFENLKETVNFPKMQKLYRQSTEKPNITHVMPEDDAIERTVQEAYESALKICVQFGIAQRNDKCPSSSLRRAAPNEKPEISQDDDDMLIDEYQISTEHDASENSSHHDATDETRLELGIGNNGEEENDVMEDLVILSSGSIGFQTYDNVSIAPDSPFLKVLDGNGITRIIKKSSYCWFLMDGDTSVSSDRLQRVQANEIVHFNNGTSSARKDSPLRPRREEKISLGDWCAFFSEDESVVFGRVLAFSYMSGSSWRNQEYSKTDAPIRPPSDCTNKKGIGCLCDWFQLYKSNQLRKINMDVQGFYDIEQYICTIPRPTYVAKNLVLFCSLQEIEDISRDIKKNLEKKCSKK